MAMKNYFGSPALGFKNFTGLKGFAEELKELTDQDREDLGVLLSEHYKEEIEITKR